MNVRESIESELGRTIIPVWYPTFSLATINNVETAEKPNDVDSSKHRYAAILSIRGKLKICALGNSIGCRGPLAYCPTGNDDLMRWR